MATRFRLTNSTTTPGVSPTLQSYTHNAPATVRRQLLLSDASALATTAYTPDAADHGVAGDALWCQFVSAPMSAGKEFVSGQTIKMAMQGLEAHQNNNQFLQLYVAVVSQDGSTVRRVLRSKVADDNELATALTNRTLSTTQDGADYTTVTGDRLVVEISISGTPGGGGGVQGHNGSMRFGGAGAGGDLPEDDSETGTTFNPWIEFVPSDLFSVVSTFTVNSIVKKNITGSFTGNAIVKKNQSASFTANAVIFGPVNWKPALRFQEVSTPLEVDVDDALAVGYGDGLWVIGGSSFAGGVRIITATDPLGTWQEITDAHEFTLGDAARAVAYNGSGTWVMVGGQTFAGAIEQSTAPTATWGPATVPDGVGFLVDVMFIEGYWYVASGTEIWRNDDLNSNTWVEVTHDLSDIWAFAYGNGHGVAVGASGEISVAELSGGLLDDFVGVTSPFGTSTVRDVVYHDGVWIAVGDGGKIATATDPTGTWSLVGAGVTESLAIAGSGGGLAVVLTFGQVLTSRSPASSWGRQPQTIESPEAVAYGNGLWVVGNDSAHVYVGTPVVTADAIVRKNFASSFTLNAIVKKRVGSWDVFPQTVHPVTDDFNRANETPISGSWNTTLFPGQEANLISNRFVASTPAGGADWDTLQAGDFEAWIEVVGGLGDSASAEIGIHLGATSIWAGLASLNGTDAVGVRRIGGVAQGWYRLNGVWVKAETAAPAIIGEELGVYLLGADDPEDVLLDNFRLASFARVSFTLDAVIAEPPASGGDFTADAIVKKSQSATLAADAAIKRNITASLAADAVVKRSQSAILTADAVVKRAQGASLAANAVVKSVISGSFTADGIVLAQIINTLTTLDSVVKRAISASFTADSVIKRAQEATILGDAVIKKAMAATFTADAQINVRITAGVSADAVIKRNMAASLAADAVIKGNIAASATADAIVRRAIGASTTADAWVQRTYAASATADAVIKKAIAGSFTADAFLARVLTADAIVLKTQAASFTCNAVIMPVFQADAVLRKTQGATFTADAFIAGSGIAAFSADAVIKRAMAGALAADALIRVTQGASLTSDSIVKRNQVATLGADAVLSRTQGAAIPADAVIKSTASAALAADAVIERTVAAGSSADAVIKRAIAGSATADAIVKAQRAATFLADAVLQKTQTASVTADAVIAGAGEGTGSFTTDAVIAAIQTGQATGNAVIRRTTEGIYTADSIIGVNQLASFTSNAIVSAARSGDFTANGVLKSGRTGAFSADAYLVIRQTGSWTADAAILASTTNSLSAAAWLSRTAEATFSADAYIQQSTAGQFDAAAVLLATRQATLTAQAIVKAAQAQTFSASAVISIKRRRVSGVTTIPMINATTTVSTIAATVSIPALNAVTVLNVPGGSDG